MRREYDQFFKSLANEDPRGILDMLGILPLEAEADVQPLDRELVREPVLIDQGFVVRQPDTDPWIAHIEAFADIGRDDPERVLWYAARLDVDTRMPVRSTILLLLERAAKTWPGSGQTVVCQGSVEITFEAKVVRIWEVPARKLLDSQHPKLMTWVPMAMSNEAEWTEAGRRLIERRDAHLLEAFRVLGSLRYGKDVWQNYLERGVGVIPSETLRKYSWLVQEWIAEGESQGVEKGLERGREQGREQGAADEACSVLRTLLELRFPELIAEFPDAGAGQSSARLNGALRRIIAANDSDEVRSALLDLNTGQS